MNNSRLGCLTPAGFLAAGLTLIVIGSITLLRGGVLFTPGALNAQPGKPLGGYTSHAEFGNRCRLCHAPFWDAEDMDGRCQDCHTDITAQRADPTTLHGALFQQSPALTCRNCHPEHRGPTAPLTDLNIEHFPHEKVGFSLQGHASHPNGQPFACQDCHAEGFPPFDQAVCETCHRQIDPLFTQAHILAFGSDCLACHDGIDTYGNDFDHNVFAFPLTGKHAEATCASCHRYARTVADLRAAPQDCFSCHTQNDPHEGRFGSDCAVCHTPNGWTPAIFDHNLAAFSLTGEHVSVACEACHIDNTFRGTPTDCFSCHAQDDPHEGRFGNDCAACHTPDGWTPATFDHNLTDFPLTGAHIDLQCTACHVNNIFRGLSTDCVACHAEPAFHAGLFSAACQQCHTTAAWRPARFTGPHTFPLDHGGGATCATCHPTSLTAYTCYSCHEHDPAKIEQEHREEGITNFTDCISCHPTGHEHEGGGGGEDND